MELTFNLPLARLCAGVADVSTPSKRAGAHWPSDTIRAIAHGHGVCCPGEPANCLARQQVSAHDVVPCKSAWLLLLRPVFFCQAYTTLFYFALYPSRPAKNKPSVLPLNKLLAFARDIASGMNHLVENDIVHCDLAARNCLGEPTHANTHTHSC